MNALWHKMKLTLEMIAFSHSIFALPFALTSFIFAHTLTHTPFSLFTLIAVIAAMVTARNTAMAWNRLIDRKIDAQNPRTQDRHLPQGLLSLPFTVAFIAVNAVLFVIICYFINSLCLYLSPITLIIICAYSYAKRFTSSAHFILGISLAIAPVGAWIAVTGHFALLPVLLGSGVLFWVAGFDILYSLQDEAFDRRAGLHSIPVRVGTARAIWLSRLCHLLAVLAWLTPYFLYPLSPLYPCTIVIIGLFLIYEQSLISPTDLHRLNRAFFTMNGLASVVFLVGAAASAFF